LRSIHVACAIIEQNGRVLATQRSAVMSMPLKWEFPGGKIDPGETPGECLRREVREELGVEIEVGRPLTAVTHRYADFTVTLYPFLCRITAGEITLHEHQALAWLTPAELQGLDWAEADRPVLVEYRGRTRDPTE
jgi:8-oxo-dGTP diphosphatase